MLAVVIPAGAVFIALIIQPDQKILEYFQWLRIMAWLQPEKYSTNAYQQQNSIMAIGSGQLSGKGLGNDAALSVKNGNFVPEPHTDFIFAVVGEELGFVGSIIILFLLLLIVLECIIIGRKARDFQGRLICGGVASLIGFQAFCHVCVVTGLMPNTGITLPFVSYGGSSILSTFIMFGIIQGLYILKQDEVDRIEQERKLERRRREVYKKRYGAGPAGAGNPGTGRKRTPEGRKTY